MYEKLSRDEILSLAGVYSAYSAFARAVISNPLGISHASMQAIDTAFKAKFQPYGFPFPLRVPLLRPEQVKIIDLVDRFLGEKNPRISGIRIMKEQYLLGIEALEGIVSSDENCEDLQRILTVLKERGDAG